MSAKLKHYSANESTAAKTLRLGEKMPVVTPEQIAKAQRLRQKSIDALFDIEEASRLAQEGGNVWDE